MQTWDAARPSRMAVLTTFAVRCIESTLGMVVEMGGRVHMSVLIVITPFVHVPNQRKRKGNEHDK